MSELDMKIALLRAILACIPQDHPDLPASLSTLASLLWTRFEQTGQLSDLDEAIALLQNTLELRPEGHPDRFMSLNNLAVILLTRFEHVGGMSDIDEGVTLLRNASELCPESHHDRGGALDNLAIALRTRFEQAGGMSDIDEAVALHRSALELFPESDPNRFMPLNNLAAALSTRFDRVGALSDLDEAVVLHHKAFELCPEEPSKQWSSINNLASTLMIRFEHVREMSDLEEAITLHRKVLDLRPAGYPIRSRSLNSLAFALETRFEEVGEIPYLDEAVILRRSALELCPQGHPNRSASLRGVAQCLLQRPEVSEQHREEAFNLYSTLLEVSQFVVADDLGAAHAWVQAAEKFEHPTTLSAYQTLLRLLATHHASLPCLPQHFTVLKSRMSSLAMDAFSASIRHGTLTDAVELLEQGRGVFWSQLTRLRSPIDEVIASCNEGKELGEKFMSISRVLRSILDSNPQDDQAWHLTNELREIVDEIRDLPGFSRFLLSPLFSDLQTAASGGPIVIVNASQYGCDAVIIFRDRNPVHIPLEIEKAHVRGLSLDLGNVVRMGKEKDVQRELVVILRQIWDQVVSPIVPVLEKVCPPRSRIWWCPTAEFSLLPLHAAGEYRPKKSNFCDLFISSYTPTLTALIRSRRTLDSITGKPRFLAVGNGETPGEPTLVNVHAELVSIGESIHTNVTFTCIEGEDAQVNVVGNELQQSEFVHFACHGIPNPAEPFESGFALTDRLLKIRDILRYDLQHTRLATLSACHATVGDEDSPDEAIHLAATMQFIGFRSVIGTMWAVDDAEAKRIMTEFYRIMVDQESGGLDHTRAAVALHKALRIAKPPLYQRSLFVHIGA